jgi:hypothetical protein
VVARAAVALDGKRLRTELPARRLPHAMQRL